MQKLFGITSVAAAATALLAVAQPAQAAPLGGTFAVTVTEGLTNGQAISSLNSPVIPGATASATFNYTGLLNLANNAGPTFNTATSDLNAAFFTNPLAISNYSGTGTVVYNGATVANYNGTGAAGLTNFLLSSASVAGLQYASYYTFDLGVLAAGTILTLTHDDGLSLFQGTTRIGNTVTGLTGAVTDVVRIPTTGDTILRYTRQNSTPSILVTDVPEPMSLGLLGAGLAGLGLIRRRKRAA